MIDFTTLYSWVKDLPIIDWHNHLDLRMLAEDRPLGSLYEVWVKSDPYKHRAMRICGEPERLITAGVEESAKWAAWMRTLPKLVGNPLFAWAKMELEWLGLDAEAYLHGRGENISFADWTPSKMLKRFNVEYLSPCVGLNGIEALDDLEVLGNLDGMSVVPSLRMNAGDEVSVEVLEKFNAAGCRVVDVSVDDASQLPTANYQLPTVAAFAAAHGWTMLLHMGALRETSARLRVAAGPAGGFAGMRAPVDPAAVAAFLNTLESMPNVFSHKEHKDNKEELSAKDNCHNSPSNDPSVAQSRGACAVGGARGGIQRRGNARQGSAGAGVVVVRPRGGHPGRP